MKPTFIASLIICFGFTFHLNAQEMMIPDTNAVKSIEGILSEVFRIYNGEPGKKRNWAAFGDLFLPSARFTFLDNNGTPGPYETVDLVEFVEILVDADFDEAFLTYETGKVVEEFNGIAHVFQSFYLKKKEGNERRGINSYQLLYDQGRWWIVSMLWTLDSEEEKIPEKYLEN